MGSFIESLLKSLAENIMCLFVNICISPVGAGATVNIYLAKVFHEVV